jgi:hypothetical protein
MKTEPSKTRRWIWRHPKISSKYYRIIVPIGQYLFCSWAHYRDRCYPQVGGRGINGSWHCAKCHPCGEVFDIWEEREFM